MIDDYIDLNETIILLVDDNQLNLLSLEAILATAGRKILKANSGKEALIIMLDQEIDLVILDVNMPQMNGFEVAQMLKAKNKTKDIPIIFASAERKGQQSILKGFEEGAVDYLFKPLDPQVVRAKVAVLLKLQVQKKKLVEYTRLIEKSTAQLILANKELESFSYSVSHDLRAPLRAINGFARVLMEDYEPQLDNQGRQLIQTIMQNALQMGQLIDDLLQFSRIGKAALNYSIINMDKMVEDIIAELQAQSCRQTSIHKHTLGNIEADHNLMRLVMMNLLSNAFKYSSLKSDPVIEIGTGQLNQESYIYIKDNGAGFDMNYYDKMFGVFQRLHRSDEFEGTGVGLAIVQRIISKHGGKVWAHSQINEGATFYFTIT